MARIRTVKPSFWGDDEIADLSIGARYLALGLISFADDQGRFLASINAITGYVFPHDDLTPKKVRDWMDELTSVGFIRRYSVGKREYGHIPGFTKHQKINRPSDSPLPPPPVTEDSVSQSVNEAVKAS